jgi:cytochrome c-type biogenesis protein CcmH/NrfF
MRRLGIALLMLSILLIAPAAAGQTPEERAARLSERIMSPFCDGVTLHDCPSAAADELRRDIAQMARDGMTNEAILDRLESDYGPGIRATPDDTLAWLLPALAVLAGIGIVAWLARRWARATSSGATSEDPRSVISAEDRARLDAELASFKGEL